MSNNGKTFTVNSHRGNGRIWFEGRWVIDAGFKPGEPYTVRVDGSRLIFDAAVTMADVKALRTVSSKKNGTVAVLDVNSPIIAAVLGADIVGVKNGAVRCVIETGKIVVERA